MVGIVNASEPDIAPITSMAVERFVDAAAVNHFSVLAFTCEMGGVFAPECPKVQAGHNNVGRIFVV